MIIATSPSLHVASSVYHLYLVAFPDLYFPVTLNHLHFGRPAAFHSATVVYRIHSLVSRIVLFTSRVPSAMNNISFAFYISRVPFTVSSTP